MFCEAGKYEMKGGTVDFVHRDGNGLVLIDTKAERLNFLTEVATKSAFHCDDIVLQAMLKSYVCSIQEPENALIHLYDIFEMGQQIPNLMEIVKQTRLNEAGGSDFGEIANNPQNSQGRHRGRGVSKGLSSASEEDLEIARTISKDIVIAYVKYLCRNNQSYSLQGPT